MTETMLEKAAKAACGVTELFGREADVVRAVLQAIREPSEEAVIALVTAPVDLGDHSGGNLVSSWRAMIDAILSGEA